jgi:outer membrane protein assembly factor BamE
LSFVINRITSFALLGGLALAGCQRMPALPGLTPFKVDIQQGNYVTQDMVDKLKAGMTKSQVRFALGTPLVADPFHNDRWDYIYIMQKAGRLAEQRRIVAVFKEDKLVRIDGDVKPAAASAEPVIAPTATPAPIVTPEATSTPAATVDSPVEKPLTAQ